VERRFVSTSDGAIFKLRFSLPISPILDAKQPYFSEFQSENADLLALLDA
jgi:hypothetical protein